MSVAIIDYGSGNLHSAAKAFERAARDTGDRIVVTADAEAVAKAERIVLPGVGAFADCRRGLDAVPGMVEALNEAVIRSGTPFLGICVGCQLMAERGLEKVTSRGLGWIAGDAVEIEPDDPELKIPHMGWNTLDVAHEHPLLAGIPTGEDGLDAYFVHSFHVVPREPRRISSRSADYGGPVTAIIARDNYAGTQFHPEKSQDAGAGAHREFSEVEAVSGGTRILSQGERVSPEATGEGLRRVQDPILVDSRLLIRLLRSHLLPRGEGLSAVAAP